MHIEGTAIKLSANSRFTDTFLSVFHVSLQERFKALPSPARGEVVGVLVRFAPRFRNIPSNLVPNVGRALLVRQQKRFAH